LISPFFLYNNTMFKDYSEFNVAKEACRDCFIGKIYDRVVLSDGCNVSPKVMVIGECPGRDEVEAGIPFVGMAGELLRPTLNKHGFRKTNTLISNVMPCRPENNKFPTDSTLVHNCLDKWLRKEINLVNPEYLLLVGAQPLKYILGLSGITKLRGAWYNYEANERNISCMVTFHPSYVLRKKYMAEGKKIQGQFTRDIKKVAIAAGFLK